MQVRWPNEALVRRAVADATALVAPLEARPLPAPAIQEIRHPSSARGFAVMGTVRTHRPRPAVQEVL
jgi:hypothetical protein